MEDRGHPEERGGTTCTGCWQRTSVFAPPFFFFFFSPTSVFVSLGLNLSSSATVVTVRPL